MAGCGEEEQGMGKVKELLQSRSWSQKLAAAPAAVSF